MMMKRFLGCIALLILPMLMMAQPYGNEWVDHSKTYHKVRISKDGLYRIPYSELSEAGLAGSIGSNLKLHFKGEEIPLYVTTTGSIGPSDYVEFVAKKNDAELDAELFADPDWQLSSVKSIITDSINYYLSVHPGTAGLRYNDIANNLAGAPPKETYFMKEVYKIQNNVHHIGETIRMAGVNYPFADYENGEGFVSSVIPDAVTGDQFEDVIVRTPSVYIGPGAPDPTLEMKVVGRSDDFTSVSDHHTKVSVNGTQYIDIEFEAYSTRKETKTIFLSSLTSPTSTVTYEAVGDVSSDDLISIAYTKLTYPKKFDFDNGSSSSTDNLRSDFFTLLDNQESYIEIIDFNGGTSPVVYDLTNNLRIVPIIESGVYKFKLPAGSNPAVGRELFITTTTDEFCIISSSTCFQNVTSLSPGFQFTNFSQTANQGDYIILTHNKLRTPFNGSDQVMEYNNYRETAIGGGFNSVIVDIEEVYDQFGWGIPKHQMAVRKFVNYAVDQWSINPEYLLLLGKSVKYSKATNLAAAFDKCLVPTYGHAASDNMLAVRDVNDYRPQLAIGRVSSAVPEDVYDYLNKVREFEAPKPCNEADREWLDDFVHIALGKGEAEESEFLNYLNDYKNIVEPSTFGGDVVQTFQSDGALVSTVNFNLAPYMEQGLACMTFIGHSSSEGGNFDFNFAEDPTDYDNQGKYPIIISGSCFIGDIHGYSTNSESIIERYVLEPDAGSIGFLSGVTFGIPTFIDIFLSELYDQFSNTNYGKPFGLCLKETIDNIYVGNPDLFEYNGVRSICQHLTYEGDPAVVMGGVSRPEYITSGTVNVYDSASGNILVGSPITVSDINSIDLQVTVNNIGLAVDDSFTITVYQTLPSGTTQVAAQITVPSTENISSYTIPVPISPDTQEGVNTFNIVVNSSNSIIEDCVDNNNVVVAISMQSAEPECNTLPAPQFNSSIPTTFCNGDGPITLNATPAGGIFSGAGVSGNTFNPTAAGSGSSIISYSFIDPETSCQLVNTLIMQVNNVPSSAFNYSTQSTCLTSSVNVAVPSILAGASYSWDFDGAMIQNNGSENYNLTWSSPGVKTVSLTASNNGCSSIVQEVNISVDAPLAQPSLSCGESTDNSVTINWGAVDGAQNYGVYINGALASTIDATNTSLTQTGLVNGESITASVIALNSSNGCGNSEISFELVCTAQPCQETPLGIVGLEANYCITDGEFNLQPNNPGGTFILDGATVESSTVNPAELGLGSHTVSYALQLGTCSYASQTYEFEVVALPSPSVNGSEVFCDGETNELTVGGGPFATYVWSSGEGTNVLEVAESGTYTVTVTNGAGCSSEASIIVEEIAQPEPIIVSDSEPVICDGQLIILSVGGGEFASYNWNDFSTQSTLNVISPSTYTVTVTDQYGCSGITSIEITSGTINDLSLMVNGGSSQVEFCQGDEINLEVDGEFASYNWSTGETTSSISPVESGVYEVEVFSATGCAATSEVEITIEDFSALALSVNNGSTERTFCADEEVSIEVLGDYSSYTWSNGDSNSSISPTETGTYSVDVVNSFGCESTEQVEITFIQLPELAFEDENLFLCPGSESTIEAPAGFDTYLWSNGSEETAITAMPGETYDLEATLSGCSTSTSVSVFEFQDLLSGFDISSNEDEICPGDEISLQVNGTIDNVDFTWLGDGLLSTTGSVVSALPKEGGTYTVFATDINGCSKMDSLTVEILEACELPNAITPNQDGYNDFWFIPFANGNPNIQVEIFNRWGQRVYSKTGYSNASGWTGTNDDGKDLPHGTYYYVINLNDGATERLSGNVSILR